MKTKHKIICIIIIALILSITIMITGILTHQFKQSRISYNGKILSEEQINKNPIVSYEDMKTIYQESIHP